MWTLILTIYTAHGIAMTQVPGFENSAQCGRAGNAWVRATEKHDAWSRSAVCVEAGK